MEIPAWLRKVLPGSRPATPPTREPEPEPEPIADVVLPPRLESLGQAMDAAAQYEDTQTRLQAHLARQSAEMAAAAPLGLAGLVLSLAQKGYDAEERSALARAGAKWIQAQEPSENLKFALQVADSTTDYQDDLKCLRIGLQGAQSSDRQGLAVQLCEVFGSVEDRAAAGREALAWMQSVEPARASEFKLGLEIAQKTETYDDEWAVLRESLNSATPTKLLECMDSVESRARAMPILLANRPFAGAPSAAKTWEDDAAAGAALLHASGSDPLVVCRAMIDACQEDESVANVGARLLDELAATHPERVELARGLIAASGYYETDRAILESVFTDRPALQVCRETMDACSEVEDRARIGQAGLNALQKDYPVASLGMLAGQAATTYDADAECCETTLRHLDQTPPELAATILRALVDEEQGSKAGQAMLPALRGFYANPEADALIDDAASRISGAETYEDDVAILKDLFTQLASVKGVREQVEDLAAAVTGQSPAAAVKETGSHVVLGHVALKVRGQTQKR